MRRLHISKKTHIHEKRHVNMYVERDLYARPIYGKRLICMGVWGWWEPQIHDALIKAHVRRLNMSNKTHICQNRPTYLKKNLWKRPIYQKIKTMMGAARWIQLWCCDDKWQEDHEFEKRPKKDTTILKVTSTRNLYMKSDQDWRRAVNR